MAQDRFAEYLDGAPGSFCSYPFYYVNFGTNGRFAPCCNANPSQETLEQLPDGELWNGELFKRLRRQVLNGEKPAECQACWKAEAMHMVSNRMERFDFDRFRSWFNQNAQFETETGQSFSGPMVAKLCFSNLCNLQCRMCNSVFSSRWESAIESKGRLSSWMMESGADPGVYHIEKTDGSVHADYLHGFLKKFASSLRQVEFLGGEPFIQPEHYNALRMLEGYEHRIRLNYSSNMSQLYLGNEMLLESWRKFQAVEVIVSIDAEADLNDYIRHGARFRQIENNLKLLWDRASSGGLRSVELFTFCTFGVYNAAKAVSIVRAATRRGLLFISDPLRSPFFLSSQVLPLEEKSKITLEVAAFLENLEEVLAEDFAAHPVWNKSGSRQDQCDRIRRRLDDLLKFMNAADKSAAFGQFLEFDRVFSEEAGVKKNVFDFYPDWQKYLPALKSGSIAEAN